MGRTGKTLVIIPTYNEVGNIERLLREIVAQGLGLDILVIDDHSPDGTGILLDGLAAELPLQVIHREKKLGIGSAHERGFDYARERGYAHVLTMDADFAHDPAYLRSVLAHTGEADVVVGSRYMAGGGLRGWSLIRLLLTHTAHWCTTHLLGLPQDCTGGFRLYDVAVFERFDYHQIRSDGYAFLIEMLFYLRRAGCSILEVPITITSRHSGVSKISRVEILNAITTLLRLSLARPGRARGAGAPADAMDWNQYWANAQRKHPDLYDRIAEFYRRQIISRAAAGALGAHLPDGSDRQYLHAGCGSGGSDQRLRLSQALVHALDLSLVGLALNRARQMRFPSWHVCGDLFRLPYRSGTMDGLFNFGVMEHFEERDIAAMLAEFHRVLKPGGRIILFWPPEFGLSVIALKGVTRVANLFRKTPLALHPDEISRIPSFAWVRAVMAKNQFRVLETRFDWRDLFTYVVVVGEPVAPAEMPAAERELAAPDEVAA